MLIIESKIKIQLFFVILWKVGKMRENFLRKFKQEYFFCFSGLGYYCLIVPVATYIDRKFSVHKIRISNYYK